MRLERILAAVLTGGLAATLSAQSVAETYGTTSTSFHRMGASEFTAIESGLDDHTDTYYADAATFRRYGKAAGASFIASPHLPSGAIVMGVYVHGCSSTEGSVSGDITSCSSVGDACAVVAGISSAAGCGTTAIDLSGAGLVVDNSPAGDQIVIRLQTTAIDGTDAFAAVTVEYLLQVSPAPAVATFGDVPTDDFGFQYVEALVAAGITGGCGSGNYCPDSPVTRRQMAIFIAKALGLHFP
jgi:hypothetical protein